MKFKAEIRGELEIESSSQRQAEMLLLDSFNQWLDSGIDISGLVITFEERGDSNASTDHD